MPLYAGAAALVLVAAGGLWTWKSSTASAPPAQQASTPADSSAGAPAGAPVTPAGTQAPDSSAVVASNTKTPETQSATPPVSSRRADTKASSAATKSAPRPQPQRTAQVNTERPAQRETPPATAPTADAGLATIQLVIDPPGTLFIDNVSKGQKSRHREQLIPGTHTVRVERDGWFTKDTTVTISAGAPATIRINLTQRQ